MYHTARGTLLLGMPEYALSVPAITLNQAVAKELADLRHERRLKQDELAAASGVSRHTIMRYEAGESIKLAELEKLCLALDEDPMALFIRAAARVQRKD